MCLAPSPAAKSDRNPHTDYPRLSRLKPNADGMQVISGYQWPMATDETEETTMERVLARRSAGRRSSAGVSPCSKAGWAAADRVSVTGPSGVTSARTVPAGELAPNHDDVTLSWS